MAGLGFTLAGMPLSALAHPLFRLPHPTFAACFQCGFRFNTYLALAAAARIGGAEGVATMSLLVGLLVPFVNVVAVAALARGQGWRIAGAIARNPLVLACVAGIAWNAVGPPMPAMAGRILELLAAAALPLGLLAVGAGLTLSRSTLAAARARLVARGQARRGTRSGVRARAHARPLAAGAPDRRRAGRRVDGAVGLHPRACR